MSESDAIRQVISSGAMPFEVEARLLQELGERLVASPEVALLELVKNASDADAPECQVALGVFRGQSILVISDNGDGMTESDFRTRWMRIATNSKREPFTKRFQRPVTGQKGIGRFAIRFLGSAVKLTSVAVDPTTGRKQQLDAIFDWRRLDRKVILRDAKVPFRITAVSDDVPTGTRLLVTRLKRDLHDAVGKSLLTRVLQIVSPSSSFDAGPFVRANSTVNEGRLGKKSTETAKADPGFRVSFIGFPAIPEETPDIADAVVTNAWARLKISLQGSTVKYTVRFHGEKSDRVLSIKYPNSIRRGLYADIIYAPKRKDSFQGVSIDRREVWSWIRRNSGIGVVDNGFRIRPYGFNDDDWLYLNQDGAHNKREWRSDISKEYFPLSEIEQARPGLNPALNVPATYQVIGLVNVASRASDDSSEVDLIPAMDREGFLINDAYLQMVDLVRGGLEFLAKSDKERLLKLEETKALQLRGELRSDLARTVDELEADPRLANEEKAALVAHYSQLAVRVSEQEEYDRSARQRLEIAAGLGVVAGFMTHEAERLFLALDKVIAKLNKRCGEDAALRTELDEITKTRDQLDGYIRYTRLFTDSLRSTELAPFSALGQIEWVLDHFSATAESRGIETQINCAEDVMVPPVPVAMYSAVLLNLYTNATKAVIAREIDGTEPTVLISAWNDAKSHHLTVQDTGIGIPASLKERIWDPFFTTTSRMNSPLGTGMGLGLPLVRDLVSRVGGRTEVTQSSPNFTTCIHISIPRNINGH